MKHIGTRLKKMLEKHGVTPREVAELVGISDSTVYRLLSGKPRDDSVSGKLHIRPETAAALAELFDCRIRDLFDEEDLMEIGRLPGDKTRVSVRVTVEYELCPEHWLLPTAAGTCPICSRELVKKD